MSIIILIPLLIGCLFLFRMPAQRIFLNVYLPALMLLPIYYFWKGPLLPPLDFAESALIPVAIAMFACELRHWRFGVSDFAILLFVLSAGGASFLSGDIATCRQEIGGTFLTCALPYMAAKLLIEPKGLRAVAVRRLVFLTFIACIFSLWEYRMGSNLYMRIFQPFFSSEIFAWKTQFRWGFGRISGPYAQSELAGIILFSMTILSMWLSRSNLWEPSFRHITWPPHRKGKVIAFGLAFSLLATQARGPWIGAIAAFPIALLGWARNLPRTALITFLALGLGFTVVLNGLKEYSSGNNSTNMEQQNAQYRQQLLAHYIPVVAVGGPFGYGQHFPRIEGQDSIDNEYLFIALTQGFVGLGSFVVLFLEPLATLLWVGFSSPPGRDRSFSFCLLGIWGGLLFTIATVYLGQQPFHLFFLLSGWSQSLRPRRKTHQTTSFAYVLS